MTPALADSQALRTRPDSHQFPATSVVRNSGRAEGRSEKKHLSFPDDENLQLALNVPVITKEEEKENCWPSH